MAMNNKSLVIAFVHFLKTEIGSGKLGDEAVEGMEVAMQCLESAYDVEGLAPPTNTDLLKIYENYLSEQTPSEGDKKTAEEQKLKGNSFMKEEKYAEAIDSYSNAIKLDGNNAIYYCNRAAAYTKLENNTQAISDCREALKIDSTYGKAYGRMGLAYLAEKNYVKAVESYEKAVNLEPDNTSYKSNLNIAREQINTTRQQQQQQPSTPAANNPLAGMDLNSLLSNPAVMNMAQSFMQNPAMQNMFSNFMGGMGGPSENANENSEEQNDDTLTRESQSQGATEAGMSGGGIPGMPGGFQLPQGLDFGNIMNATQQVAAQLREENPDLADSLRNQFQQGQNPPPNDETEKKE